MKMQKNTKFPIQFLFYMFSFERFKARFFQSELGKIYLAIPWDELVKSFGLREAKKGPKPIFPPRGKIALMFLKSYSGFSDKMLIEHLNGNPEWQFFCGIDLWNRRLTSYKIVSAIRCKLAEKLDIDELQKIFASYWASYIQNKAHILLDATCYESEVRYPTDQKLLWECVDWLYSESKKIHKSLGIKHPKTTYPKWQERFIAYNKMRKKPRKKRISLTRGLLRLLHKLNGILDEVEKEHPHLQLPARYHQRRATIKKIYQQQEALFRTGESPKNRIISLSKPYLHPIVRGKEVKPVEFGAKVNKVQIDGINFIEHLSFNNFNEGTRVKSTVFYAYYLTQTTPQILGADGIYATNENRRFLSSLQIQTDFKPKGKRGKHHEQKEKLRKEIRRERVSRLEGSFGNEKEHYHLRKIKARTQATEILWIFFGIHTANALKIGRRKAEALKLAG